MRNKNRRLRVVEGKGRTYLPGLEKIMMGVVILLFIVLLLQMGYQWISSWWLGYRLQVETAEPGTLRSFLEVEGIVTREEKIMRAPCSGVFEKDFPSGERIAVGEKVGTLQPFGDGQSYSHRRAYVSRLGEQKGTYAGIILNDGEVHRPYVEEENLDYYEEDSLDLAPVSPGILSYAIDGMEGYGPGNFPYHYLLAKKNVGESEEDEEEERGAMEGPKKEGENSLQVEEGDPLFKIATDWSWYFSVVLEEESGREVARETEVSLQFPIDEEREIKAERVEVIEPENKELFYLTYRLDEHLTGFVDVRETKGYLYYREYEGVLIPEEALQEKEGEKGVYINQGGVVVFQPVEVVFSQDDQLVVDDLQPYTLIILNPDLVEEGQRLE